MDGLDGVQIGACGSDDGFGVDEFGFGAWCDDAGAQGGHDVLLYALGVCQRALGGGGVGCGVFEGGDGGALIALECRVAEQFRAHAGEQRIFDDGAWHAGAAGAHGIALVFVRCAAVAIAIDDDQRAAAVFAAQDAAEQMTHGPTWAALFVAGALGAGGADARLRGRPGGSVDDGQFWLFFRDPLGWWALLAYAPAGVGVLDPMAAVPNLPTNVDGVGEDADAAANVAVDGGEVPLPATRRRYLLRVEGADDLARAVAGDVIGVDSAHHGRLRVVDGALAHGGDDVAVGQAAGAGASERAAGEPSVSLIGEVIEVELAHQATQADVCLAGFASGVHAVTDPDQAHACELEPAHRDGALCAVTAQPTEVVDQHHVVARQLRT
ncbi:MAG: hypothetical protein ABIU96_04145 [Rhodanobacter sp.]